MDPILNSSSSPYDSEHTYDHPSGIPYDSQAHQEIFASMPIPSCMTSRDCITSFSDMSDMTPNMPTSHMPQQQMDLQQIDLQQHQADKSEPEKPYSCTTCAKCFGRRSDLSRHERIHSGHRPHACDFLDCNKQFIQRSALTIHRRVHTGEKPHICAVCAKSFSDSSSLARHRRTHAGRRPYRCPYAHCQKTFTRKTTLTRHQTAHPETLEEASAATAATLAACGITPANQPRSPGMDTANGIATDYQHQAQQQQHGTLPPHMRVDSPLSTTSGSYTPNMPLTSHPAGLTPSIEQHEGSNGGASGSPLVSNIGWHSPSESDPRYVYPDEDTCPLNATAMRRFYYSKNNRYDDPIADLLEWTRPEQKLGQSLSRDSMWWTLSN